MLIILLYIYTLLDLFNISSISSGGIIFCSTGSCFTMLSTFDLVYASAMLFPMNSSALWSTFLEAVFKESSPVSNNSNFLANDRNSYHLT